MDGVCALEGFDGVLVVCRALHMCMVARGVEMPSTSTVTSLARGKLASDASGKLVAMDALLKELDALASKAGESDHVRKVNCRR